MPDHFELDPVLDNDTYLVTDLPLCRVLLMNDKQYPWLILVPRINGVTEIIDLTETQQQQLWQESNQVSVLLKSHFNADKLNVAALGNVVPQLHVHHIARFKGDPAWPAPVWGKLPAIKYSEEQKDELIKTIRHYFQN